MPATKIKDNIYWVGAIDWGVRVFHGHTYSTKRGTTYNSYLILDDKIALVDTVFTPFSQELIENIRQIIDPGKIDYVVVNHLEPDHIGALPEIMKLAPKAKLLGTAKCKEGLFRNFYEYWDFQVVKTGDKINLGKKSLSFIEAPMIHWPDSMFTYCPEEKLLMPNDAFGQHYATAERFDDEVSDCELMEEAKKYYANILWPFSVVIQKKIEEIKKLGLAIEMIAPSHGIIWKKSPRQAIDAYLSWVKNEAQAKVAIVYETMYEATEKMAKAIAGGLLKEGVAVNIIDIAQTDRTEAINKMFDAKGYLIGSSTHDNDMLPTIYALLEFLKGLRPQNRLGAAFGSYGWAGGAIKSIENTLTLSGVKIAQPGIGIQYVPSSEDLKQCFEFGRNFAKNIK